MELTLALISIIILIYSAILHEIAHGIVAERLGDPTARIMGRLTLDPRAHIDPILSVLLPLVLILGGSPIIFGAAKPVPVDPFNLKDGRKDMALVSLAGPATNFLLAILGSIISHIIFPGENLNSIFGSGLLGFVIASTIYLNLILAIFNLIPIPPLDGSKVLALLLPEKEAATYLSIGTIGIFIIFFLLMFPIGGFSLGSFIGNLLLFSEHLLGL
jgi:Zn-dependent protease